MGEMSMGSHLLFTGHDKYFPVEMFIASVEELDIKEEEGEVVESLCQRALQRISSDIGTPAGKWRFSQEARAFSQKEASWSGMKESLMASFGRSEAYTAEEKLEMLILLKKHELESVRSFWSRVQWVVLEISGCNNGSNDAGAAFKICNIWTNMIFLMGLNSDDRGLVLESCQNTSVPFNLMLNPLKEEARSQQPKNEINKLSEALEDSFNVDINGQSVDTRSGQELNYILLTFHNKGLV